MVALVLTVFSLIILLTLCVAYQLISGRRPLPKEKERAYAIGSLAAALILNLIAVAATFGLYRKVKETEQLP